MQEILIIKFAIFLQVIVALGLVNVWLVRFKKSTKYRSGNAKNMIEEFQLYGLPKWFMYIVGFMKITIAIMLVVGIFINVLVLPAAAMLVLLMLGAVGVHVKVKDPIIKYIPAVLILGAAIFLVAVNSIF